MDPSNDYESDCDGCVRSKDDRQWRRHFMAETRKAIKRELPQLLSRYWRLHTSQNKTLSIDMEVTVPMPHGLAYYGDYSLKEATEKALLLVVKEEFCDDLDLYSTYGLFLDGRLKNTDKYKNITKYVQLICTQHGYATVKWSMKNINFWNTLYT
jgi:predicted Fe-S protein YdhL (DUF1289 family)